jgi:multiple antibiotic resistance protein
MYHNDILVRMNNIIGISLYLLVVINPISKIVILSSLAKEKSYRDIRILAVKSTIYAMIILTLFTIAGNVVLNRIFHIELYSLKVAGGIILFSIGFNALIKGLFFEITKDEDLTAIALVPLASPMIAGPGSITASLSFSIEYGMIFTLVAIGIALIANCIFMLSIRVVYKLLNQYHFTGALIRITGLIVATLAVQMIFDGVKLWIETLHP